MKNSIGLRLLRVVFGCYFAITVVVTIVQLVSEYRHIKEDMFTQLDQVAETLKDSIASALWSYDIEQMQSIVKGAGKIEIVKGASITAVNQEIFAQFGISEADPENTSGIVNHFISDDATIKEIQYLKNGSEKTIYHYTLKIYYNDIKNGSKELIGYSHIFTDNSSIIQTVKREFIIIITSSIIKTLALWLIFLYFTNKYLAIPLSILIKSTKEIEPDRIRSYEHDKCLQKIIDESNPGDEIYSLSNSFSKMREAIIRKINIIEKNNKTLENRVEERTQEIEKTYKELKHLYLHDTLTGLPNRKYFQEHFEITLQKAKKYNNRFAIASIDFREFKKINDEQGHLAGDTVLKEISGRIRDILGEENFIGRLGGDEFAILINTTNEDTINIVSNDIIACTDSPVQFNNKLIDAKINIGFAFYPEHGTDSETLFKHADIAMYEAKKINKNQSIFTEKIAEKILYKEKITKYLPSSIKKNEFLLHYQPIISCNDGSIKSAEALVRWQHPTLGFIAPDDFISIAEQTGKINQLTEWVLNTALADKRVFTKNGLDLNISVNISGFLLDDIALPQTIKDIADHQEVKPEQIVLEITETSMLKNPKKATKILLQLRNQGFNISIDDFGTGYSSLAYLSRLPANELKIDRSFMLGGDVNKEAIIEAIITVAHRLNLAVVAEGIEDKESLDFITRLKSDYVQGYFFSRPLPRNEFIHWANIDNESAKHTTAS